MTKIIKLFNKNTKTSKSAMIILVVCSLILNIFFVLQIAYTHIKNSESCYATVDYIDVYESKRVSRSTRVYYTAQCHYTVNDVTYNARISVDDSVKEGEQLLIYYDPANPGVYTPYNNSTNTIVYMFFGIFIILTVIFLVYLIKKTSKTKNTNNSNNQYNHKNIFSEMLSGNTENNKNPYDFYNKYYNSQNNDIYNTSDGYYNNENNNRNSYFEFYSDDLSLDNNSDFDKNK